MKYYTIQDNNILIADNEQALTRFYNNVFELPEDYEEGKYIPVKKETQEEIEVIDYDEEGNPIGNHTEIIIKVYYVLELNPDYEQEQAEKREQQFNSEFLSTSLGNYRLIPKGYANAQQSIDTVDRLVNYAGGLTGELLENIIFYPTPDFTKPEECTEEWLIAHQYNPREMTIQEWASFYLEFSKKYAAKMYKIKNEKKEE